MKSIFKKIILVLLIITTILNTVMVISFVYLWNTTNITDLSLLYPKNNIKIYDINNIELANLSETYNSYTPYELIPKDIINATLAIEDSRFFEHKGIDYEAIARALVNNLKSKGYSEGASTITQQLIKNVYLSNEKTIERKITEAILALKLENILSKEDILASYLSNVLFGGRIYGIKLASKYYFNKELNEIKLVEAALLAGLLQMPNYYNPFTNYDIAVKRTHLVLKSMLDNEFISEKEYNNAINIELSTLLEMGKINENIGIYASYIDYATNLALDKYNINLNQNDVEITIGVDSEIQNHVHQIMKNNYNNFPDDNLKCGIVVLDNDTGNILAIGGNRSDGMKNLNYATDVYNQPGSTIKPILSYGPAFEYLNYFPQTQILDEPYYYTSGQQVKNWDNKYIGHTSLRYALSNSRNIPAIKLYNKVGHDLAWKFAESIGIKNKENYTYEAMAIGGFERGYSVLEMTNSYQAFANMGVFIEASPIIKIKENDKEIIVKNEGKRVFSKETAFIINNILHDVLRYTGYDLTHTFLSSKTGQTNYDLATKIKYNIPENATKDSWCIAYTKDITVGTWVSYDKISSSQYLLPHTKNIPIDICIMILNKFSKNALYYEVPQNLKLQEVDIINGLIYEPDKYNNVYDYFYKGFIPLSRENLDYDLA